MPCKSKQIYVIEHLEPKLGKWTMIEYGHISKIVRKSNLWFTNIKHPNKNLKNYGKAIKESVSKLDLDRVCILDPESNIMLSPKEAKSFRYFIFGGILGDYPPKKRTKKELTQFIRHAKVRNIGKRQMSTDNAVKVVHEIASGTPLSELKFKYKIELPMRKCESLILPYQYLLVNGKPFMSLELLEFLKRKRGF